MEDIKEIVFRSVDLSGSIHYTLDEQFKVIAAFIKDKKGVEAPSFGIGGGMTEMVLLNHMFYVAAEHFCKKFNTQQ